MSYFFTSESVSEGHPDKVADQISDALLDHFLAFDENAKVACETLVTTGQVILAGEVKTNVQIDVRKITRDVIKKIGYDKSEYLFDGNSCGILSTIHNQSADINRGVSQQEKSIQGAGDQGIMFGYATNETENYLPLTLDLSHQILKELANFRKSKIAMPYLRPDAKSQVTIEYTDDGKPLKIREIVLSTQHDPFMENDEDMVEKIRKDVIDILIPQVRKKLPLKYQALLNQSTIYHINPTGRFVIGGPHGDTGLTGRKIIVDTYGGKVPHGGGAFSGKDPSKVDRSAAYATRHAAKNLVAAGVADELLIQISYAIGEALPISIYVNTFGTSKVAMKDSEIAILVGELFDMRPTAIKERLKLNQPIYFETAAYGHMGRIPKKLTKIFENAQGVSIKKEVELFTWEKLDNVDKVKNAFGLKH
jgi:S-adenosylmethionine synthetase